MGTIQIRNVKFYVAWTSSGITEKYRPGMPPIMHFMSNYHEAVIHAVPEDIC